MASAPLSIGKFAKLTAGEHEVLRFLFFHGPTWVSSIPGQSTYLGPMIAKGYVECIDGFAFLTSSGVQACIRLSFDSLKESWQRERRPMTNGPLVEVGMTNSGWTLFRQENGVGGHAYWSDAIGGGVPVWDTALVSEEELLLAMRLERDRKQQEADADKPHVSDD